MGEASDTAQGWALVFYGSASGVKLITCVLVMLAFCGLTFSQVIPSLPPFLSHDKYRVSI